MAENVESLLKEIRQKNSEKRRNKILSGGKPVLITSTGFPADAPTSDVLNKKKSIDLEEVASRVEGKK